jgi:hypothetical protein
LDIIALSDGLCELRADWLDRFKPYTEDGKTIVVSPHKVWGAVHVDDTSMTPLLCI